MSFLREPCCPREMLALVYELIDAHTDTVELRLEVADNLAWETHLDYLRALQRTARGMLASGGRVIHPTGSEGL